MSVIGSTAVVPASPVIGSLVPVRRSAVGSGCRVGWTSRADRPWPASMVAPAFPILPEPLIPEPSVVPTVFEVTMPADILPAVSPYRHRQLVVVDSSPRAAVIVGTVPVPVPEDEIGMAIIDDVVASPVGDREAVIVKVDKIRSAVEADADARKVDADPEVGASFVDWLYGKRTGDADDQQHLFFHWAVRFDGRGSPVHDVVAWGSNDTTMHPTNTKLEPLSFVWRENVLSAWQEGRQVHPLCRVTGICRLICRASAALPSRTAISTMPLLPR